MSSINSKFIYAKTKANFELQIPTIPEGLNPIAFIEDTKEMWTCGTYFSIGYPGIVVSEVSGNVEVDIGNTNFTLQTSGESLSIRKGIGNNIILNSSALSKVDTEPPLQWDAINKKLLHLTSGVVAGLYGQSSDESNASIFSIPYINVDTYGHITSASSKIISIRDYVEQLSPTNSPDTRSILVSYNAINENTETAQVRKAKGLTYNDLTGVLGVAGGITSGGGINVNGGDLTVVGGEIIGDLRGNVTGQATPKIHLSDIPEYGGASTELYGHVKVQDSLISEPPASSNNTDPASSTVTLGVAASPKMVWDAKSELHNEIINAPSIGGIDAGDQSIEITKANQRISVNASQGITAVINEDAIIIKGIGISGYDENLTLKAISENLTLGEDFSVDSNNEASIRWVEL